MPDEARFRIDELALQYSLHPDLRDLYVEGQIDKAVLRWFLRELDLHGKVTIYPIDAVHVPADVMRKHKQRLGEKGEVIALAMELQERLPNGHEHLTLIADADYDYVLDRLEECSLLLYTDGTTLDMYAFNEHPLEKFLQVALGAFRYRAPHVLAVLTPVLLERFLARTTNESLGWGMCWPASLRCVVVKNDGTLDFDIQRFVDNYLRQNHRHADRDEFRRELERLRRRVTGDMHRYIRGQDFAALLSRFLSRWVRQNVRNQFSSADAVAAGLRGCLEAGKLRREQMFRALIRRVR